MTRRFHFFNWVQAPRPFSHEVRHVGGSCCGGCDLTKAAFLPTNPSLAVWTQAQPPLDRPPLFLSRSHWCVSCTYTLSLTYTRLMLHAQSQQEFSTQQQENIAASCAVNCSICSNPKDCLQTSLYSQPAFSVFSHVYGYRHAHNCRGRKTHGVLVC